MYVCVFVHRTDDKEELEAVQAAALEAGAFDAVICSHWAQGGAGATKLGEAVERASSQPRNFKFLYGLEVSYHMIKIVTENVTKWLPSINNLFIV